MRLLLLIAFLSGLTTIFAPGIWPLLPVVLSIRSGIKKPFGIALGVSICFAIFTLAIAFIITRLPINTDNIRLFSTIVIGFLGLTLLIPQLSNILDRILGMFSKKFSGKKFENQNGFLPSVASGVLYGAAWLPCSFPLLVTMATVAATRKVYSDTLLITLAYVLGVGIPLFLFVFWGGKIIGKSNQITRYSDIIQKIAGIIMVIVAISIYFNLDRILMNKLRIIVPAI